MSNNDSGVNRRQFLGRAGMTVAASGLIVTGCRQQAAAPAAGEIASTEATAGETAPEAAPAQAQAEPAPGPWAFGNQIEQIRERGRIIIGSTMRYPPQSYRDPETNEPAGYDIEVGKMLAQDLEVELEWADVEFDALLPGLISGKYDLVIVGIANKPSRALSMQFTRGYVPYDQVMLVQEGMEGITLEELNQPGTKITAQEGATAEFRARELFPLADIVPLKVPETMLEVAAGRAAANLIEAYLALPFAANHPTTTVLRGPTGDPVLAAREWGSFPVRLSEHGFMHYLDNWLNWYWERGTLPALYDRIVGPTLRGEVTWDEE